MINENQEKICLCIDTSTKVASAAIGKCADGQSCQVLYSVFINDGLTHSENLIPIVNQCLSATSLSIRDIDVFACINGPGSFTGLRIGISTANALAQSARKDIIGISSLEALAYTFNHFDGLIVPMIDARRDNVFNAVFDATKGFSKIIDDETRGVDEVLESIEAEGKRILFVGDGAAKAQERAKEMFADRAVFASGISNNVNSTTGIEIAFKKYFSAGYTPQKVLMPHYVKGTSAKTVAERNAK